MLKKIQQLVLDKQQSLQDLLDDIKKIDKHSSRVEIKRTLNNSMMTKELDHAFAEWYIANNYTVSSFSPEEHFSPSIKNVLSILEHNSRKDRPMKLIPHSECFMSVNADCSETEDYFLLTPKRSNCSSQ